MKERRLEKASIRYTIFIYFTVTALAASIFASLWLYTRLSGQMAASMQEENQILISQINRSMESYLRTVMKLSDSLYYGVIKNADLSQESIGSEITLLYDNNKDNIENIGPALKGWNAFGIRAGSQAQDKCRRYPGELVPVCPGEDRKRPFLHAPCTIYL